MVSAIFVDDIGSCGISGVLPSSSSTDSSTSSGTTTTNTGSTVAVNAAAAAAAAFVPVDPSSSSSASSSTMFHDTPVVPCETVSSAMFATTGGMEQQEQPSPSEEADSPRRSGRARVSTTTIINGHTVLRKNNYSVTAGSYIYDDTTNAMTDQAATSSTSTALSTKKKQKQETVVRDKKPRVESEADAARRIHNESVMKNVNRKVGRQLSFLAKNVDVLRPFCEKIVIEQLENAASTATTTSSSSSSSVSTETANNGHVPVPSTIKATLRSYQRKGLDFLVKMDQQNVPCIIGDEMGLGKTLQTITFLSYLKEHDKLTGPSLVICPLSVLSSWSNEVEKWSTLKCFRLHASSPEEQVRQKQVLRDNATDYDIILTTYEMAKVPVLTSFYQRLKFHYLILDEGHKIKGHETQISQTVRKIHCGNRLILTGTPLQNNLVELWSILEFLLPKIFTTKDPFEKNFSLAAGDIVVDKSFLAKTQRLLHLFMLRRLKKEVEQSIPPKLETKVYCPLSKTQKFWYKSLLMKDMSSLATMEEKQNNEQSGQKPHSQVSHNVLKSLFMQLRKCCNHPFMFEGAEADPDSTSIEELIGSSGKLSVLDMLLRSLYKKGNRAVIFSQFTSCLAIIEDYCVLRGWKYCRMDGGTERARRNYYINRFNEDRSPFFIFLVSTRSGGMGLNLQTADTCILYDSDWNPQSDIQAMGRVHRIGQTKTVHVYRLVSSGTIEERMIERAEKKLLLEMVNKESNGDDDTLSTSEDEKVRGLSAKELLEDIKFGCNAVFGENSKNDLPSLADIEVITDRTRTENDSVGRLQGNASKSAVSFDASMEFSDTQFFGGANFREIRKQHEEKLEKETPKGLKGIAHLWQEIKHLQTMESGSARQQRSRTQRIVNIAGAGSGYGSAMVPVLASNNYDLLNGESSVFDRELGGRVNKANFEVKKKKQGPLFENQDHCQVCGDGGSLVCCSRCPCSVHLKCVGLRNVKMFKGCTHHNCFTCGKSRASAGGLLYLCEACPRAFCEDCLPSKGVSFLEKVDRFESLGFNSTKHNVYIHCSKICRNYSIKELGFIPPTSEMFSCPKAVDLSSNFGSSQDVDEVEAAVHSQRKSQSENKLRSKRRPSTQTNQTKWLSANQQQYEVDGISPEAKKLKRSVTPDEADTKPPSVSVHAPTGTSAVDAIELMDDSSDESITFP